MVENAVDSFMAFSGGGAPLLPLAALVDKLNKAASAPSRTSLDAVNDALNHLETEVQLTLPNILQLQSLLSEVQQSMILRLQQATADIKEGRISEIFGPDEAIQAIQFRKISERIVELANKKTAEINAATARVYAETDKSQIGATPPPSGPVDNAPNDGDDGRMEKRIEKLEADVAAIKLDVGVIKANGASKSDLAELKGSLGREFADLKGALGKDFAELKGATKTEIADLKGTNKANIAEAKNTIIMWVVGSVVIAQLLPALLNQVLPLILKALGH